MLKRYTVSFDVFDLHGKKIDRGRRDVFADTSLEAKNEIAKAYRSKEFWRHVKVKNYKIEKFVPTEEPSRASHPQFIVEYKLVYPQKDVFGGYKRGATGYYIYHESHQRQKIEADNRVSAAVRVKMYWKKLNPLAQITDIKITEVKEKKKGARRRK
jgi:hypothetical protein